MLEHLEEIEKEPSYNSISAELKPCDDVISRDMALEKMADYVASGYANSAEDFEEYSRIICQLPPVTPQPKTGHWIDDKCSVCGKGIEDLIDSREWYENEKPNYCPFCGKKFKKGEK